MNLDFRVPLLLMCSHLNIVIILEVCRGTRLVVILLWCRVYLFLREVYSLPIRKIDPVLRAGVIRDKSVVAVRGESSMFKGSRRALVVSSSESPVSVSVSDSEPENSMDVETGLPKSLSEGKCPGRGRFNAVWMFNRETRDMMGAQVERTRGPVAPVYIVPWLRREIAFFGFRRDFVHICLAY